MDDDDQIIETDQLFTRPFRTIFGRKRHSWLFHRPRLTYTVVVGRNVGSDTQTLDSIINAAGRVRVDGDLGDGTAVRTLASFVDLAIGETAYIDSGDVAGNATAVIPAVTSAFGEARFEVQQILQTLLADASIATRIMLVNVLTGMPAATGAGGNDAGFAGPTGITASQSGRLFIPRAPGLAQLNDNGTITTADVSPLPLLGGDGLTLTSVITAGVVGDVHRLSCIARRVA